jgi:hypothetical protein
MRPGERLGLRIQRMAGKAFLKRPFTAGTVSWLGLL